MKSDPTKRLKAITAQYQELRKTSKYDDLSDLEEHVKLSFLTKCRAGIESICGPSDAYRKQSDEIIKIGGHPGYIIAQLFGVVDALQSDIENGYLATYTEVIHGDMFSDYLEMAAHLSDQGYKDSAAVIAGSSLEVHLRNLCAKYDVDTLRQGGIGPKKADTINADLVKADVYSKLDQKNVTAWLGLRNMAAHGNYSEYDETQIKLLIDNIRNFILRVPA